jgi:hypothetical protein
MADPFDEPSSDNKEELSDASSFMSGIEDIEHIDIKEWVYPKKRMLDPDKMP